MKLRLAHRLPAGALAVACVGAHAWGNEGHQVAVTIAQSYMTAKTLAAVNALLAKDTSPLTPHNLAGAATWADAYRASSTAAYDATHQWHFADIEVQGGTLKAACFGFPPLPAGTAASAGPVKDCHVDKINEALAELGPSSKASTAEQVLALKYVLHFVGDLHQPLHSADQNDSGGNAKSVSATKLGAGNLHAFWDSPFVAAYGTSYAQVANAMVSSISKTDFTTWYAGTPADWAQEAYALAVSAAYGPLPAPNASGVYVLPDAYVSAAEAVVGTQLKRAGVRLAWVLNKAYDPKGKVPNVPAMKAAAMVAHDHVPSKTFVAEDLKYHRGDQDH